MAHHHPTPIQRLAALVHAERKDLSVIVVYSAAIGVLTLATPVAVQSLVNTVAFGTVLQPIVVLTVLLAGALVAQGVLQCLRAVAVEVVQRRLFVRLAATVADVLLRVRISAFDTQHGPELVNRFLDVATVQKSVAVLLIDGLTVFMQTGVGLLLLALYHPYLLVFDALMLLTMLLILFGLGRRAVTTAIEESYGKYDMLAWLEEMARHQVAFRSATGTSFALNRTNALATRWLGSRKAHFRILLRQLAGSLLLQMLALATLLGAGGWLVITGELTLGQLVAAELIVGIIVAGFVKFNKSLESFYDMQAAIDKLGHLIDLPVEEQAATAVPVAGRPGSIDWHGVSFAYEGGRELLVNSHLSIPAGACMAIYGRGGEGKSTVIDLLAGLRLPSAGVMQLNGLDYREYGLTGVRSHIALVRDIEIFPGSLLENVRLGSETTSAEVIDALVRVGLEETLLSLPEGVRTELSGGGQPLSRSQALRLMLARAIVRRPDVLVLDEVLDHLDDFDPNGTLAQTLFGPDRPWTLVIATEDRGIAAHCDRVISPSGGRLLVRLPSEIAQFAMQGGSR